MKKIILFGMGAIGKDALMFYKDDVYCFVDNDPQKAGKTYRGKKIISFSELLDIYEDYDIIVSCLDYYDEVAKQLTQAGITNFKKFVRPVIFDYIPAIKSMMPKELLSSDKMDVVVRYLYAKDILSDLKDTPSKSLYARMMLSRTGCSDEKHRFTFMEKQGLDEYIQAFINLCENMRDEGFNKDYPIPITEDNSQLNGKHRLAAALASDEKIYASVVGKSSGYSFGFDWFEENGFSFEDKTRILKGFADLYEECGLIVLYGPAKEQWDYIDAQLQKEFRVVGSVDIDLSHNFIAFEILIREIYGDYYDEGSIADKISLLKMAPLITKVILVSNELKNLEINEFYDRITDFKKFIRDSLNYDFKNEAGCVIHATSCYAEFEYMKNILLSVNNLKSIEGRISSGYRSEFLSRILFLRNFCKENNIPIEEVCIVGSTTMEVYGIRNSRDFDFIISSDLRSKFPRGHYAITDIIGMCDMGHLRTEDGKEIANDVLINNDSYHFWFYGCKFADLNVVKNRKIWRESFQETTKDIQDLRLIQLYDDFIKSFDDKMILKEQIQKELKRREKKAKLQESELREAGSDENSCNDSDKIE